MPNDVRQQIMTLINSYGPDVLDMSGTVASELHLACPGCHDEVEGLVAALRHGVVHYLLVRAEAGKLETSDLPGQVSRLCFEAGLSQADAQRAVDAWAEVIGALRLPRAGSGPAWRHEPKGLHQRYFGLGEVVIVGMAGLIASMLPWLVVLEEKRGHHFLIPVDMDALGAHALLNLLGAAGGFLGGALGWMVGSPLSLDFQVNRAASGRRLIASSLAAALGSFFGLWAGYHHFADIGTFLGSLLGAGLMTFLATVFTFKYQPLGIGGK
jgi:hypothetical protein